MVFERAAGRRVAVVVGASLLYATVRYNVVRGVPWSDWPVYVVNKAIALASLLLMVRAVWSPPGDDRHTAAGVAGRLAFAHVMLSVILLGPVYYPLLYADGHLTWTAGLALLTGVTVALSWRFRGGTVRPAAFVAAGAGCHAALFGYGSWFAPSTWPGLLPPITLLSFLAGLAALPGAFRRRA